MKNFEKKIEELETIVKKLETSDINLDESIQLFERGISLYNDCNKALKEAENKIEILNKETLAKESFDDSEELEF